MPYANHNGVRINYEVEVSADRPALVPQLGTTGAPGSNPRRGEGPTDLGQHRDPHRFHASAGSAMRATVGSPGLDSHGHVGQIANLTNVSTIIAKSVRFATSASPGDCGENTTLSLRFVFL